MVVVLPESVIIEILSWLPVKAVLRFKSVCKSWYAIIASPHFISKHLENYYNKIDNPDCFLTVRSVTQAGELEMGAWLVDGDPLYESLDDIPLYNSKMWGPCNGIYYLYVGYLGSRALWNPTINELKFLPPVIMKPDLPANFTYDGFEAYGFGFDPLTKDYKVVVIKGYGTRMDEDNSYHPPSVLVYSLRTDSWKYWGDLQHEYIVKNNGSYIFVSGCLYWLGLRTLPGDDKREMIISFNIAVDALQEIPVPMPSYDERACTSLGIHHDSVALYTAYPCHENENENEKCFDIWTLTEGIFSKRISIGPLVGIWRPIGHFKNDKAILQCDDGALVLCDPNDPDAEELRKITDDKMCCGWTYDGPSHTGVSIYKESLVSIKGFA